MDKSSIQSQSWFKSNLGWISDTIWNLRDNGYPTLSVFKLLDDISYTTICGDVDADGSVTIVDATCIQRHIAELAMSSYNEPAADADGDGSVTINDATCIQRYLVQLACPVGIGKPIS